jgi:peptidyl-prolyl cis-trans isomerase SurA
VKKYGDKDQQSFSNDGRVTNPQSGNTFFEIGDLETSVYFAIEGLKEGDVAEPFEFKGPDRSHQLQAGATRQQKQTTQG